MVMLTMPSLCFECWGIHLPNKSKEKQHVLCTGVTGNFGKLANFCVLPLCIQTLLEHSSRQCLLFSIQCCHDITINTAQEAKYYAAWLHAHSCYAFQNMIFAAHAVTPIGNTPGTLSKSLTIILQGQIGPEVIRFQSTTKGTSAVTIHASLKKKWHNGTDTKEMVTTSIGCSIVFKYIPYRNGV